MEDESGFAEIDSKITVISDKLRANNACKQTASADYCQEIVQITTQEFDAVGRSYEQRLDVLRSVLQSVCRTVRSGGLEYSISQWEMLKSFFTLCTKVILNFQWQTLPPDNVKKSALTSVINEMCAVFPDFSQLSQLVPLMDTAWSDPIMMRLLQDGDDLDDDEEDETREFIMQQDDAMLKIRIEVMLAENCEEFAENLCSFCVFHPELESDLYVHTTLLTLVHKLHPERLQDKCQQISSEMAIQILTELQKDPAKQSLCVQLSQLFLVHDWINSCDHRHTPELLELWVRHQYASDSSDDQFTQSVWSIAKLCQNTGQLGMLIDCLRKERWLGSSLQLFTDLSIYALNLDKPILDQLKSNDEGDPHDIVKTEESVISTCTRIDALYEGINTGIQQAAMLTVFALEPSKSNFVKVEKTFRAKTPVNEGDSNRIAKPGCICHLRNRSEQPFVCKCAHFTNLGKNDKVNNGYSNPLVVQDDSTTLVSKHQGVFVDPWRLYELERLLQLFRPWYMHTVLQWDELTEVCSEYSHEKTLSDEKQEELRARLEELTSNQQEVKIDGETAISRDLFLAKMLPLQNLVYGKPKKKNRKKNMDPSAEPEWLNNCVEEVIKKVSRTRVSGEVDYHDDEDTDDYDDYDQKDESSTSSSSSSTESSDDEKSKSSTADNASPVKPVKVSPKPKVKATTPKVPKPTAIEGIKSTPAKFYVTKTKCKTCEKIFDSLPLLNQHKRLHLSKGDKHVDTCMLIECVFCISYHYTMDKFQEHLVQCAGKKAYEKNLNHVCRCGDKFSTPELLKQHFNYCTMFTGGIPTKKTLPLNFFKNIIGEKSQPAKIPIGKEKSQTFKISSMPSNSVSPKVTLESRKNTIVQSGLKIASDATNTSDLMCRQCKIVFPGLDAFNKHKVTCNKTMPVITKPKDSVICTTCGFHCDNRSVYEYHRTICSKVGVVTNKTKSPKRIVDQPPPPNKSTQPLPPTKLNPPPTKSNQPLPPTTKLNQPLPTTKLNQPPPPTTKSNLFTNLQSSYANSQPTTFPVSVVTNQPNQHSQVKSLNNSVPLPQTLPMNIANNITPTVANYTQKASDFLGASTSSAEQPIVVRNLAGNNLNTNRNYPTVVSKMSIMSASKVKTVPFPKKPSLTGKSAKITNVSLLPVKKEKSNLKIADLKWGTVCTLCSLQFNIDGRLLEHLAVKHLNVGRLVTLENKTGLFECKYCVERFKEAVDCLVHFHTHESQIVYDILNYVTKLSSPSRARSRSPRSRAKPKTPATIPLNPGIPRQPVVIPMPSQMSKPVEQVVLQRLNNAPQVIEDPVQNEQYVRSIIRSVMDTYDPTFNTSELRTAPIPVQSPRRVPNIMPHNRTVSTGNVRRQILNTPLDNNYQKNILPNPNTTLAHSNQDLQISNPSTMLNIASTSSAANSMQQHSQNMMTSSSGVNSSQNNPEVLYRNVQTHKQEQQPWNFNVNTQSNTTTATANISLLQSNQNRQTNTSVMHGNPNMQLINTTVAHNNERQPVRSSGAQVNQSRQIANNSVAPTNAIWKIANLSARPSSQNRNITNSNVGQNNQKQVANTSLTQAQQYWQIASTSVGTNSSLEQNNQTQITNTSLTQAQQHWHITNCNPVQDNKNLANSNQTTLHQPILAKMAAQIRPIAHDYITQPNPMHPKRPIVRPVKQLPRNKPSPVTTIAKLQIQTKSTPMNATPSISQNTSNSLVHRALVPVPNKSAPGTSFILSPNSSIAIQQTRPVIQRNPGNIRLKGPAPIAASTISPMNQVSNRGITPVNQVPNRAVRPPNQIPNRTVRPANQIPNRTKTPSNQNSIRTVRPPNQIPNRAVTPTNQIPKRTVTPTNQVSNPSSISQISARTISPIHELTTAIISQMKQISPTNSTESRVQVVGTRQPLTIVTTPTLVAAPFFINKSIVVADCTQISQTDIQIMPVATEYQTKATNSTVTASSKLIKNATSAISFPVVTAQFPSVSRIQPSFTQAPSVTIPTQIHETVPSQPRKVSPTTNKSAVVLTSPKSRVNLVQLHSALLKTSSLTSSSSQQINQIDTLSEATPSLPTTESNVIIRQPQPIVTSSNSVVTTIITNIVSASSIIVTTKTTPSSILKHASISSKGSTSDKVSKSQEHTNRQSIFSTLPNQSNTIHYQPTKTKVSVKAKVPAKTGTPTTTPQTTKAQQNAATGFMLAFSQFCKTGHSKAPPNVLPNFETLLATTQQAPTSQSIQQANTSETTQNLPNFESLVSSTKHHTTPQPFDGDISQVTQLTSTQQPLANSTQTTEISPPTYLHADNHTPSVSQQKSNYHSANPLDEKFVDNLYGISPEIGENPNKGKVPLYLPNGDTNVTSCMFTWTGESSKQLNNQQSTDPNARIDDISDLDVIPHRMLSFEEQLLSVEQDVIEMEEAGSCNSLVASIVNSQDLSQQSQTVLMDNIVSNVSNEIVIDDAVQSSDTIESSDTIDCSDTSQGRPNYPGKVDGVTDKFPNLSDGSEIVSATDIDCCIVEITDCESPTTNDVPDLSKHTPPKDYPIHVPPNDVPPTHMPTYRENVPRVENMRSIIIETPVSTTISERTKLAKAKLKQLERVRENDVICISSDSENENDNRQKHRIKRAPICSYDLSKVQPDLCKMQPKVVLTDCCTSPHYQRKSWMNLKPIVLLSTHKVGTQKVMDVRDYPLKNLKVNLVDVMVDVDTSQECCVLFDETDQEIVRFYLPDGWKRKEAKIIETNTLIEKENEVKNDDPIYPEHSIVESVVSNTVNNESLHLETNVILRSLCDIIHNKIENTSDDERPVNTTNNSDVSLPFWISDDASQSSVQPDVNGSSVQTDLVNGDMTETSPLQPTNVSEVSTENESNTTMELDNNLCTEDLQDDLDSEIVPIDNSNTNDDNSQEFIRQKAEMNLNIPKSYSDDSVNDLLNLDRLNDLLQGINNSKEMKNDEPHTSVKANVTHMLAQSTSKLEPITDASEDTDSTSNAKEIDDLNPTISAPLNITSDSVSSVAANSKVALYMSISDKTNLQTNDNVITISDTLTPAEVDPNKNQICDNHEAISQADTIADISDIQTDDEADIIEDIFEDGISADVVKSTDGDVQDSLPNNESSNGEPETTHLIIEGNTPSLQNLENVTEATENTTESLNNAHSKITNVESNNTFTKDGALEHLDISEENKEQELTLTPVTTEDADMEDQDDLSGDKIEHTQSNQIQNQSFLDDYHPLRIMDSCADTSENLESFIYRHSNVPTLTSEETVLSDMEEINVNELINDPQHQQATETDHVEPLEKIQVTDAIESTEVQVVARIQGTDAIESTGVQVVDNRMETSQTAIANDLINDPQHQQTTKTDHIEPLEKIKVADAIESTEIQVFERIQVTDAIESSEVQVAEESTEVQVAENRIETSQTMIADETMDSSEREITTEEEKPSINDEVTNAIVCTEIQVAENRMETSQTTIADETVDSPERAITTEEEKPSITDQLTDSIESTEVQVVDNRSETDDSPDREIVTEEEKPSMSDSLDKVEDIDQTMLLDAIITAEVQNDKNDDTDVFILPSINNETNKSPDTNAIPETSQTTNGIQPEDPCTDSMIVPDEKKDEPNKSGHIKTVQETNFDYEYEEKLFYERISDEHDKPNDIKTVEETSEIKTVKETSFDYEYEEKLFYERAEEISEETKKLTVSKSVSEYKEPVIQQVTTERLESKDNVQAIDDEESDKSEEILSSRTETISEKLDVTEKLHQDTTVSMTDDETSANEDSVIPQEESKIDFTPDHQPPENLETDLTTQDMRKDEEHTIINDEIVTDSTKIEQDDTNETDIKFSESLTCDANIESERNTVTATDAEAITSTTNLESESHKDDIAIEMPFANVTIPENELDINDAVNEDAPQNMIPESEDVTTDITSNNDKSPDDERSNEPVPEASMDTSSKTYNDSTNDALAEINDVQSGSDLVNESLILEPDKVEDINNAMVHVDNLESKTIVENVDSNLEALNKNSHRNTLLVNDIVEVSDIVADIDATRETGEPKMKGIIIDTETEQVQVDDTDLQISVDTESIVSQIVETVVTDIEISTETNLYTPTETINADDQKSNVAEETTSLTEIQIDKPEIQIDQSEIHIDQPEILDEKVDITDPIISPQITSSEADSSSISETIPYSQSSTISESVGKSVSEETIGYAECESVTEDTIAYGECESITETMNTLSRGVCDDTDDDTSMRESLDTRTEPVVDLIQNDVISPSSENVEPKEKTLITENLTSRQDNVTGERNLSEIDTSRLSLEQVNANLTETTDTNPFEDTGTQNSEPNMESKASTERNIEVEDEPVIRNKVEDTDIAKVIQDDSKNIMKIENTTNEPKNETESVDEREESPDRFSSWLDIAHSVREQMRFRNTSGKTDVVIPDESISNRSSQSADEIPEDDIADIKPDATSKTEDEMIEDDTIDSTSKEDENVSVNDDDASVCTTLSSNTSEDPSTDKSKSTKRKSTSQKTCNYTSMNEKITKVRSSVLGKRRCTRSDSKLLEPVGHRTSSRPRKYTDTDWQVEIPKKTTQKSSTVPTKVQPSERKNLRSDTTPDRKTGKTEQKIVKSEPLVVAKTKRNTLVKSEDISPRPTPSSSNEFSSTSNQIIVKREPSKRKRKDIDTDDKVPKSKTAIENVMSVCETLLRELCQKVEDQLDSEQIRRNKTRRSEIHSDEKLTLTKSVNKTKETIIQSSPKTIRTEQKPDNKASDYLCMPLLDKATTSQESNVKVPVKKYVVTSSWSDSACAASNAETTEVTTTVDKSKSDSQLEDKPSHVECTTMEKPKSHTQVRHKTRSDVSATVHKPKSRLSQKIDSIESTSKTKTGAHLSDETNLAPFKTAGEIKSDTQLSQGIDPSLSTKVDKTKADSQVTEEIGSVSTTVNKSKVDIQLSRRSPKVMSRVDKTRGSKLPDQTKIITETTINHKSKTIERSHLQGESQSKGIPKQKQESTVVQANTLLIPSRTFAIQRNKALQAGRHTKVSNKHKEFSWDDGFTEEPKPTPSAAYIKFRSGQSASSNSEDKCPTTESSVAKIPSNSHVTCASRKVNEAERPRPRHRSHVAPSTKQSPASQNSYTVTESVAADGKKKSRTKSVEDTKTNVLPANITKEIPTKQTTKRSHTSQKTPAVTESTIADSKKKARTKSVGDAKTKTLPLPKQSKVTQPPLKKQVTTDVPSEKQSKTTQPVTKSSDQSYESKFLAFTNDSNSNKAKTVHTITADINKGKKRLNIITEDPHLTFQNLQQYYKNDTSFIKSFQEALERSKSPSTLSPKQCVDSKSQERVPPIKSLSQPVHSPLAIPKAYESKSCSPIVNSSIGGSVVYTVTSSTSRSASSMVSSCTSKSKNTVSCASTSRSVSSTVISPATSRSASFTDTTSTTSCASPTVTSSISSHTSPTVASFTSSRASSTVTSATASPASNNSDASSTPSTEIYTSRKLRNRKPEYVPPPVENSVPLKRKSSDNNSEPRGKAQCKKREISEERQPSRPKAARWAPRLSRTRHSSVENISANTSESSSPSSNNRTPTRSTKASETISKATPKTQNSRERSGSQTKQSESITKPSDSVMLVARPTRNTPERVISVVTASAMVSPIVTVDKSDVNVEPITSESPTTSSNLSTLTYLGSMDTKSRTRKTLASVPNSLLARTARKNPPKRASPYASQQKIRTAAATSQPIASDENIVIVRPTRNVVNMAVGLNKQEHKIMTIPELSKVHCIRTRDSSMRFQKKS